MKALIVTGMKFLHCHLLPINCLIQISSLVLLLCILYSTLLTKLPPSSSYSYRFLDSYICCVGDFETRLFIYVLIVSLFSINTYTQNGEFVEAVIMRYDSRLGVYGGKPRSGGVRSTLCVSSQVLITHCY